MKKSSDFVVYQTPLIRVVQTSRRQVVCSSKPYVSGDDYSSNDGEWEEQ